MQLLNFVLPEFGELLESQVAGSNQRSSRWLGQINWEFVFLLIISLNFHNGNTSNKRSKTATPHVSAFFEVCRTAIAFFAILGL
jgi:hypothetical protein